MKIIVVSDTHISEPDEILPQELITAIKSSDLCIHAGDLITPNVIKLISKYTKFIGVYGNMDPVEVRKLLSYKQIIEIENVRIGVTHGSGSRFNIIPKVEDTLGKGLNIYIFGHTHTAYNEYLKGKLFFNPGSPTDKLFAKFNSYGILEINNKEIRHSIVRMEDK